MPDLCRATDIDVIYTRPMAGSVGLCCNDKLKFEFDNETLVIVTFFVFLSAQYINS